MNRIKHIHRNKTFDLLLTKVSLEALNLLTEEMKRLPTLERENNSCGHILRSSCGLPCACELSQYVTSGLSIPLDSINEFWKKLNFEPAQLKRDEQTPHTDDLHEYQKAFAEAYAKQESPVVKMSWLQKLKGIWDPSSTNYDEPAVQTKTRGRPSTKSKTQNKPDLPDAQPPLQRSYSTRPPRHSSYVPFGERDFAQQPTRHSSFREYTDQHPPAPSSFRDSDDIHGYQQPTTHNSYRDFDETPGYHSAYENYKIPTEPRPPYNENTYWNPFINQDNSWNPYNKQNTFGFTQPTEPTTFENQDAPADQDCSYYPSAGPTYSYFGVNDNTAEQNNFTTTEGPTEYDFLGLNQHNVGDRKSADYHNNIDQIPTVFQPYVKDIKNVLGDGNCGFRATASALGYNEDDWLQIRRMLIDEMVQFKRNYKKVFGADYDQLLSSLQWSGTGFAPEEYWMSMPYSGLLIANRFNVIVHFITKEHNSSSTLFPLWRGPDQFPEKNIITIAHVNSNHFIMVEMEGDFPMATTNNLWTHMKSKEATKWKRVFKARQDHYKSSFPEKPAEPAIYQTID